MPEFDVKWHADDGGPNPRPQTLRVYPSDFAPMSDEDLRRQISDMLLGDFRSKIKLVCDPEPLVAWAKEQIAAAEAGE